MGVHKLCYHQGLAQICECVLAYLVFVQLTVLILLFSLLLEGNNDEAHKYVHHEEGNKDEVDDIED